MTEREALDLILKLKPEDFENDPFLVAGTDHNPEKMRCMQEGVRAVLYWVRQVANAAECTEANMKVALEDLVAWEKSPGMTLKWRYGDDTVRGFSEWADKIWTNAKKLLKWA